MLWGAMVLVLSNWYCTSTPWWISNYIMHLIFIHRKATADKQRFNAVIFVRIFKKKYDITPNVKICFSIQWKRIRWNELDRSYIFAFYIVFLSRHKCFKITLHMTWKHEWWEFNVPVWFSVVWFASQKYTC